METDCPWPTKTIAIQVKHLHCQIDIIANFDDVLETYATQYPDDTDTIPYFADIWPSARALAHYLVMQEDQIRDQHIIELGCGLGLPAIVAAKLEAASVTASDFHPAAIPYCKKNAIKNGVAHIRCHQLDWRNPDINMKFDCIIGSDLLYEEPQIHSLLHCITQLQKPNSQLILADPLRKHIQEAANKLESTGWKIELHPIDEILILHGTRARHTHTPPATAH